MGFQDVNISHLVPIAQTNGPYATALPTARFQLRGWEATCIAISVQERKKKSWIKKEQAYKILKGICLLGGDKHVIIWTAQSRPFELVAHLEGNNGQTTAGDGLKSPEGGALHDALRGHQY